MKNIISIQYSNLVACACSKIQLMKVILCKFPSIAYRYQTRQSKCRYVYLVFKCSILMTVFLY